MVFLTNDEITRLLGTCDESGFPELYIIVVLALSTGTRKSELRWLYWDDVDLQQGILLFRETKNGTMRSVPLVGLGLELLRDWSKIRRVNMELVFPGKNSQTPILFERSWRTVLNDAEIKDFRFHDLRHSAASYLVMNGVHLRTVAEIMGHKTLSMVQRYSHLSPEHLRSEVARTMKAVNLKGGSCLIQMIMKEI